MNTYNKCIFCECVKKKYLEIARRRHRCILIHSFVVADLERGKKGLTTYLSTFSLAMHVRLLARKRGP